MVQSAGYSDVGKVRKNNEDCFLLDDPSGLYIVADGMGGHRGGSVASRIAVDAIAAYLTSPAAQAADVDGAGSDQLPAMAADRLRRSIALANRKIFDHSVADEACRGMGTTVSALYLSGDSIVTANVGDSPIYLLRNGEIENLYTPHTLLHEYKKIPKALAGRFSNGKLAHVLTRAVGIRSDVDVDVVETPCFVEDVVVLCSDGLSGKVARDEIRDVVCQNDAEGACRQLTEMAIQRGGEDNITVVVVHITGIEGGSSKSLMERVAGIPAWVASFFRSRGRA